MTAATRRGVRLQAAAVSRWLNSVPRTVHNPGGRAHVITVGRLTVYIQLQSMSRSPLLRRQHPRPQMPWKPHLWLKVARRCRRRVARTELPTLTRVAAAGQWGYILQ